MKHLFTSLLLLCATAVTAHDFEVGGIYYNITDATNKTVAVTYKGSSYSAYSNEYTGDVVIPESVTYNSTIYSVTSIGYRAFQDCTGLTSIVIPNSVTIIGGSAFYGCSGLTSIEIPSSVTRIGYEAFNGCTSLKELRIEDGEDTLSLGYNTYNSYGTGKGLFYDCPLETIYLGRNLSYKTSNYDGYSPFYYKNTLTSVIIGNSVTSIGDYAFEGCSGLTSVEIPNSVTSIGNSAFEYCTGLTSVVIGNSVTSIGNEAFYRCFGLTSITIPNSVTSIGDDAFWGCTGLTSVVIGNGVTSIGMGAFEYCTGLTSVTIPNSVTNIGYEAFYKCTGLTSVVIGNSVTSIGDSAFDGCTGLTSVVIGNSVTSIGNDAFYDTPWYNNQPEGVVYAGKVLYDYKGTMPSNTSITIKDGTLGIAGSAFSGCTRLTSITIPNSVTSIGYAAFRSCTGLTSVVIGNSVTSIGRYAFSGTAWYNSQPDGVVYAGKVLYKYKGTMPSNTSITIKEGTLGIADYAFYECSGLTSIEIPNSVTSIGEYAFYKFTGLTSVVIGNSVTSIGDYAFYDCFRLTSITIPNSVTSIGGGAFQYCKGLTSITIPNSVTSIGYAAFRSCTGLTSITSLIPADELFAINSDVFYSVKKTSCTLYVPVGTKETYASTQGWKDFVNIVEKDFTGIDEVYDEVKGEGGKVEGVYYDLNGRAVKNPAKGIYIINGKKVLIK